MPRSMLAASSGAKDSAYGLSATGQRASCPVVSSRNSGDVPTKPSKSRRWTGRPSHPTSPLARADLPLVFHAGRTGRRTGRARSFNRRLGIDVLVQAVARPLRIGNLLAAAGLGAVGKRAGALVPTKARLPAARPPRKTLSASEEPAYAIAEKGIIVTHQQKRHEHVEKPLGKRTRSHSRCAFFINFPHFLARTRRASRSHPFA